MLQQKRVTRKQKRILSQQGIDIPEETIKYSLTMEEFYPLTETQKRAWKSYKSGKNLLLHGVAGTGKTYIAMHFALKEVLDSSTPYKKLIIVRSTVPTRDIGFLPGKKEDKEAVYEDPYVGNAKKIFNLKDAYSRLKQQGYLQFISTSFIRGTTLDDCIIIVDEINNLTGHELDSIITRVGDNCKIVFCGDITQSDFTKENDKKGLSEFIRVLNSLEDFEHIEFGVADIVRSGLVRNYLIAKLNLSVEF